MEGSGEVTGKGAERPAELRAVAQRREATHTVLRFQGSQDSRSQDPTDKGGPEKLAWQLALLSLRLFPFLAMQDKRLRR